MGNNKNKPNSEQSQNHNRNDAWILPYEVAAEQEAEDEHKDGCPKHHNVDVKGKVLEPYIWHPEAVVREIGAHGYSKWGKRKSRIY